MTKRLLGLFLLLLMAAGLFMEAQPVSAAKGDKINIGYVNRQKILASYPGVQDVVKKLDEQRAAAQKEYDSRAKNKSEQERAKINDEIAMRIAQEEAKVMNPIAQKIEETIAKVIKAQGCDYVFDAGVVIYGGKDLTDFVIKELDGK